MRRLLVAAAVSLASANQPFSWADAQNGHCYAGWWTLDGSRTIPPKPEPKRRRGPGPRGPLRHNHPAGAPRKHRDPERARARARAVAAARPHHKKWSPRDVAAAIADEVGRNEQKA